ncbi:MAG: alpha/beta hydrolase, partial [Oscillospiraceae bacterium]
GAETVMLMSAQPLPECVRCAVEDCGYSTAYGAILNVVRKSYRAVPFKVIAVEIASIINRLVCGFSFRDIAAVRAVEKSAVPMLFIHGDADRTVPVQMVYELYDACTAPKELLIVGGATHGVSYFQNPELYKKTVFEFEDKYFV